MRFLAMSLAAALSVAGVAQDPVPPPEGFPIATRDHAPAGPFPPVTWVDGARTSLETYYPTVAPPVTGWPVVFLFHGTGGSRNLLPLVQRGTYLAKRGYVCIAYDLRSEGDTVTLNPPPWDMSEEARMRDIAEAIARANQWVPAGVTVDSSRVAVSGESMGGRQAYRAAAWSGQPLPPAPSFSGPYTTMPPIAAIAPRIAPLDLLGNNVRDDILMNAESADEVYDNWLATQVVGPLHVALVLEDYAAVASIQAGSVTTDYFTRLQTSSVPMLISNVWDDAKHPNLPIAEGLTALPATTPLQFFWTTNGHSSASNDWEQLANDEKIRRWFDRFLKNVLNGVDLEPKFEVAYPPDTTAAHLTPTWPWNHALFDQWPPTDVVVQALYLREPASGRRLDPTPPPAVEPGAVVTNLPIAYDMLAYLPSNRHPPLVQSHFVPESEEFPGAVLTDDLEIVGRPRFVADVVSTAGDFYVTARLWSVDANGAKKMITAGTYGVRGGQAGQHHLVVELEDTGFLVPAGNRLELDLTNLSIHRCANVSFLRWVPCFVPSNTTVLLTPASAARIELPVRTHMHGFVAPRYRAIEAATPVATWDVSGGRARAGENYLVLLSQSGFAPGASFPPATVPLVFDGFTWLAASMPTAPLFAGFSGQLDVNGKATATLDLSAVGVPPFLLGLRFTLAVLGTGPGGYWGGGPAEFDLVP